MHVTIKFKSGKQETYNIHNKFGAYESGTDLIVVIEKGKKLVFDLQFIESYDIIK